jgi:hypothetical protein
MNTHYVIFLHKTQHQISLTLKLREAVPRIGREVATLSLRTVQFRPTPVVGYE